MKENIKINFFVTSEAFLMDQGTGNLSLINIFENINSSILPLAYPKFSVAVNFTVFEPIELKCFFVIKDFDGIDVIKSQEFQAKTTIKNQKMQLLNNFINVAFDKQGTYSVVLFVSNEVISAINLNLKKT